MQFDQSVCIICSNEHATGVVRVRVERAGLLSFEVSLKRNPLQFDEEKNGGENRACNSFEIVHEIVRKYASCECSAALCQNSGHASLLRTHSEPSADMTSILL